MIDLTNINPGIEIKTGKSSGSGWLFFILVSIFIAGFYLYNKNNPDKTRSIIDLFTDEEVDDVEDQEVNDIENQEPSTEDV